MKSFIQFIADVIVGTADTAREKAVEVREWFLGVGDRIEQPLDPNAQFPETCSNERLANVVLTQLARVAPGYLLVDRIYVERLRTQIGGHRRAEKDYCACIQAAEALLESIDSADSDDLYTLKTSELPTTHCCKTAQQAQAATTTVNKRLNEVVAERNEYMHRTSQLSREIAEKNTEINRLEGIIAQRTSYEIGTDETRSLTEQVLAEIESHHVAQWPRVIGEIKKRLARGDNAEKSMEPESSRA